MDRTPPREANQVVSMAAASRRPVLIIALLTFQLVTTSSRAAQCEEADVPDDLSTLLLIREQFGNPPALALSAWQPGTDHCGWPHVTCGGGPDDRRRVVALSLNGVVATASTTIPPAIAELDQLSSMTLSGNRLVGAIPRSLETLPHLIVFGAADNGLVGTIPPRLVKGGKPGRPLVLSLSNNRLSGTIPWVYGVERYVAELKLANNRLAGDASFLFLRHKAVADMDLSGNRFVFNLTGLEMPMQLSFLSLSRNRLYGGVPASLRTSRVAALDLSYNELCGEIPTGGRMARIKAEAYGHNKCLCGAPLPPCASGH